MILPVQFFNRRHHVLGIDSLLVLGESTQKGGITQRVNQSGYATGVTVNGRERMIRDQVVVLTARNL